MNKINIKALFLGLPFILVSACTAQNKAINTAEFSLSSGAVEEIITAKEEIDMAAVNEKTKNAARMYFVKGKVYCRIYEKKGNELIKPYSHNAGLIAGESFWEFYKHPDPKKSEYKEDADIELRNVFIATFYESQTFSEDFIKTTDVKKKPLIADTLTVYYRLLLNLYDKLDTATSNDFKRSTVDRKYFIERLAYFAIGNSDIEKRKALLTSLVTEEKPTAAVVEALSRLYLESKDTLKAKEVIKAALVKSNNDNEIFTVLVNFYISAEKENELFADVDNQIKQNPTSKNYWIRGYLNEQRKDYDAAMADYRESKKLDEFNYDACWNLGVALYKFEVRKLNEQKAKTGNVDEKKKLDSKILETFIDAKTNLQFASENTNYKLTELKDIAKALRNVCLELNDKACASEQRDKIRNYDGVSISIGSTFKYRVSGTGSSFDISYNNKMNTVSSLTDIKGTWEKEFDYIDKSDMLQISARNNGKSGNVKVELFVNGVLVKEMQSEGNGAQASAIF